MIDKETTQTLLDLLNPLHGSLDRQTYGENLRSDFNLLDDHKHDVIVTQKEERDLTQAVMIIELRLSAVPTVAAVPIKALEDLRLYLLRLFRMDVYKAKFSEIETALESVGKGTE